MPPDAIEPGSAADWLRHASSDLAIAVQSRTEGVLIEALCFHAQQSAEKAIKAVLVNSNVEFPYTHNIARLITIVQESGIAWPDKLNDAVELTEYAVQTRYPGVRIEVTEEDYQKALWIAKAVLNWATSFVSNT